jgi:beta-fructofuranosidase
VTESTGPLRPRLHFTPASGWINDPLGLTHRNGTYHLYFQHVPGSAEWAPACSWGHATSTDLLHWTEGEVALAPGDGDGGCWSGSVVTADDGETVLFYTSVAPPDLHVGRVRTARPLRADLAAWRKDPGVAVALPPGVAARTFRDPFVFADGERWWMLVGAGLADGTATALAYVSDDLSTWEYRGRLAERHRDETEPVWTGAMWECPQLVRIGDRHVLVVSVWDADTLHHVSCAVGRFAGGRFETEAWHRLSWGTSHYAASAFRDRDGRPGLLFWLRGIADASAGWSGAISLPYRLGLDGDRPVLTLHESVVGRRTRQEPSSALEVVWQPSAARDHLLLVDEAGKPLVRLCRDGDRLLVDEGTGGADAGMPYAGGDLRIVLDGPVLEVVGTAGVLAVAVRGDVRTARPRGSADVRLEWWSLDTRP